MFSYVHYGFHVFIYVERYDECLKVICIFAKIIYLNLIGLISYYLRIMLIHSLSDTSYSPLFFQALASRGVTSGRSSRHLFVLFSLIEH